mmetsp:Transcript_10947/g.27292  ORF Transcript_10947/g.27292 Transcript_10947/m.27292 type:complete len:203 (+) Transcript_10947:3-611(+)
MPPLQCDHGFAGEDQQHGVQELRELGVDEKHDEDAGQSSPVPIRWCTHREVEPMLSQRRQEHRHTSYNTAPRKDRQHGVPPKSDVPDIEFSIARHDMLQRRDHDDVNDHGDDWDFPMLCGTQCPIRSRKEAIPIFRNAWAVPRKFHAFPDCCLIQWVLRAKFRDVVQIRICRLEVRKPSIQGFHCPEIALPKCARKGRWEAN